MEPLTATRLQVRRKNTLKDCVAVAGPLGVTHFLILSRTDTSIYLKLMRLPGGPTLTFQIHKYTLVRDVVSSLRRHRMHEQQFTHAPLLVLNSFGPHGMHVKLMATMFQNLFPSLNVHKVGRPPGAAGPCHGLALWGDIEACSAAAVGLRLCSRGRDQRSCSHRSRVWIFTLCPLAVHKTEEELQAILAAKEEKLRLKAQRQEQQAQNVQRKRERREAHKKKSLAGMKRAGARAEGDSDAEDPGTPLEAAGPGRQQEEEEEEDEAEYFRQAVGEEPDEDMFPRTKRRRLARPPGRKQQAKEPRPRGRGARPCNFSAAANHVLSSYQENFLCPVLIAEFLVAMTGNGLALHRLRTREPRPWNPAVVFSVQLAVSNLLYALTLPPLAAYLYPPKSWAYGAAACRLERFLFTCNLLGGIVFLTCISLTRYLGVVHPFFARCHLQPKCAWAVSVAGWALAALLAAPTLVFSGLKKPVGGQCSVWAASCSSPASASPATWASSTPSSHAATCSPTPALQGREGSRRPSPSPACSSQGAGR
ncbi:uncharacterized protein LOC104869680 [Fukomys damarensis]|uniref:uncharacterized protein LOC104869680 n=1 Tax=Fukomys damarensis TaxID=885580 RepID=UPI0008FF1E95|nr:uncharacterized protein LOC104869680 [Fukomys damarensis]